MSRSIICFTRTFPFAIGLLLNACSIYQPQSLAQKISLPSSINALTQQMQNNPQVSLINIDDGLNLAELSILALFANPDLAAKRAQVKVVSAQTLIASALPDPQLSYSQDQPADSTSGLFNAWSFGLNFDITSLMTHGANQQVGEHLRNQSKLELLWAEWQVIQQVQSLAVQHQFESERIDLLVKAQNLYESRYQYSSVALAQGNTTLDVIGSDLTTLLDNLSQLNTLRQLHNETHTALCSLLGVAYNAEINLTKLPENKPLDPILITSKLDQLAKIRPDLLALQAGYLAQESRVKGAILSQFPAFNLGISKARDSGKLSTSGFNIGLSIPLFGGTQAAINTEQTTRDQLKLEFYSRLATTENEVHRLQQLQQLISEHYRNIQQYLTELIMLVERGKIAYQRGDIDALSFLNMESTNVNKQLELLELQQSSWQIQIALNALLVLPQNAATMPISMPMPSPTFIQD